MFRLLRRRRVPRDTLPQTEDVLVAVRGVVPDVIDHHHQEIKIPKWALPECLELAAACSLRWLWTDQPGVRYESTTGMRTTDKANTDSISVAAEFLDPTGLHHHYERSEAA